MLKHRLTFLATAALLTTTGQAYAQAAGCDNIAPPINGLTGVQSRFLQLMKAYLALTVLVIPAMLAAPEAMAAAATPQCPCSVRSEHIDNGETGEYVTWITLADCTEQLFGVYSYYTNDEAEGTTPSIAAGYAEHDVQYGCIINLQLIPHFPTIDRYSSSVD